MSEFRDLMSALVEFRDARDWQQFHDSKNLAVALSIEAAELNEVFLWKDVNASEEVNKEKKTMFRDIEMHLCLCL
jgi:NTP pyrophosphatase (non-canonical NTP hydrolase)